MLWYGELQYPMTELDFSPLRNAFLYIPSSLDKEALTTAIEYFLRGEEPPKED
jgi:hypothetical protein